MFCGREDAENTVQQTSLKILVSCIQFIEFTLFIYVVSYFQYIFCHMLSESD